MSLMWNNEYLLFNINSQLLHIFLNLFNFVRKMCKMYSGGISSNVLRGTGTKKLGWGVTSLKDRRLWPTLFSVYEQFSYFFSPIFFLFGILGGGTSPSLKNLGRGHVCSLPQPVKMKNFAVKFCKM